MSLYNALFGENVEKDVLLGMIGLTKSFFERFRDIHLIKQGTVIRVFTRLGGGNREYYEDTWEKIMSHKLYITDYDDDFDCTYAYIEFSIPDMFKETAKKMFKGEPMSFEEKFNNQLEEMKRPGSVAYKKAEEIAKQISDGIENSNGNGINIIKI